MPLAAYVPGDDSKILFVASSCDMITFSSPASLTSYRTSYKALYIKIQVTDNNSTPML